MKTIAKLTNSERAIIFNNVALSFPLKQFAIEKDYWVCFILDHLFHDSEFHDLFVFKGGTSLSKAYHVIERFSEDIDLILDWRQFINEDDDPWQERSKNKQDKFNKQLNNKASEFFINKLIPTLTKELATKINGEYHLDIDKMDNMVINFYYPLTFSNEYMRNYIRLEIGPLARWIPSHHENISPFVCAIYPDKFIQNETSILTTDVERTFWEKISILHKISNFPIDKQLPKRYARHYYDIYMMASSWVKEKAFERMELLEDIIQFDQKFYYTKSADYPHATTKEVQLLPSESTKHQLLLDYDQMLDMFYGYIPKFSDILSCLKTLQEEIHQL